MTPAQRLACLPGCWRPGMLSLQYGVPARLVGQDDLGRWNAWDRSGVWVRYTDMVGIEPDLTDPATVGCLAAWCREVYGDPFLHAVPTGARWQIRTGGWRHRPAVAEGITECDAWAAAILAKLEPK